jgi:predicted membrane protein
MSNLPLDPPTITDDQAKNHHQMAFFPLLIALCIFLLFSVIPQLLIQDGIANHGAASLLFWAMSAGFTRGVGFIPKFIVPRLLLSTYACLIGVLGAVIMILH